LKSFQKEIIRIFCEPSDKIYYTSLEKDMILSYSKAITSCS